MSPGANYAQVMRRANEARSIEELEARYDQLGPDGLKTMLELVFRTLMRRSSELVRTEDRELVRRCASHVREAISLIPD